MLRPVAAVLPRAKLCQCLLISLPPLKCSSAYNYQVPSNGINRYICVISYILCYTSKLIQIIFSEPQKSWRHRATAGGDQLVTRERRGRGIRSSSTSTVDLSSPPKHLFPEPSIGIEQRPIRYMVTEEQIASVLPPWTAVNPVRRIDGQISWRSALNLGWSCVSRSTDTDRSSGVDRTSRDSWLS